MLRFISMAAGKDLRVSGGYWVWEPAHLGVLKEPTPVRIMAILDKMEQGDIIGWSSWPP